jgi:signal transduction histidine kinase
MVLAEIPAAVAALVALGLSAIVLASNKRRPMNRLWAFGLLMICLWQACIALAHQHRPLPFVQYSFMFAVAALMTCELIRRAILAPWKSLWGCLLEIRSQVVVVPIAILVFTRWVFSPDQPHEHGVGYWCIFGLILLWASGSVVDSLILLRRGKISGCARADLLALAFLVGGIATDALVSRIWRLLLNTRLGPEIAAVILIAALCIFGRLVARDEIQDLKDLRKDFASWSARGIMCFGVGLACIFILSRAGQTSGSEKVGYSLMLAVGLAFVPLIDGWFGRAIDRKFASRNLADAEVAINRLIESSHCGELHGKFRNVLLNWSNGSSRVFLSGAPFEAGWPGDSAATTILPLSAARGWVTPEILDREGPENRRTLESMLEAGVGAAVCFTAASGESLTAVFEIRNSLRPFVTRELREAQQLLQMMQLGLALGRLRQKLRGDDRLNLYAKYAPRFAHELRNGLYLQRQILAAVAEGRWAEVNPADAKAGLESLAKVDRLCTHFFNAGSLFERPVGRINLDQVLAEAVHEAKSGFAANSQAVIQFVDSEDPRTEVLANPDLLRTAVLNLIKNAVEAVSRSEGDRFIVVNATRIIDQVQLLVQDSGPGLPPNRRAEPFQPAESKKQNGMGLGLAIARDCVEAMGGKIGVRFTGAAGTCFEITLNAV